MKKIMLSAILICLIGQAQAQSVFNQKGEILRRLAEQIAGLGAYKEVLSKSYKVVKGGMQTIGDLKNGDLKLHFVFFNGLSAVNPNIKKWSKIPDIIRYQLAILKLNQNTFRKLKSSKMYSEEELQYLYRVFGRLLEECEQAIDDLTDLITDGRIELKDDERIKRLEKIRSEMQERYQFAQGFSTQTMAVAAAKLQQQQEVNRIKTLNK